jgi:hypothetical protein
VRAGFSRSRRRRAEQGDAAGADAVLVDAEPPPVRRRRTASNAVEVELSVLRLTTTPHEARQVLTSLSGQPRPEASGDQPTHGRGSSRTRTVPRAIRDDGRGPRAGSSLRRRAGDRRTMSWILGAMSGRAGQPSTRGDGIRRRLAIRSQARAEPAGCSPSRIPMLGVPRRAWGAWTTHASTTGRVSERSTSSVSASPRRTGCTRLGGLTRAPDGRGAELNRVRGAPTHGRAVMR